MQPIQDADNGEGSLMTRCAKATKVVKCVDGMLAGEARSGYASALLIYAINASPSAIRKTIDPNPDALSNMLKVSLGILAGMLVARLATGFVVRPDERKNTPANWLERLGVTCFVAAAGVSLLTSNENIFDLSETATQISSSLLLSGFASLAATQSIKFHKSEAPKCVAPDRNGCITAIAMSFACAFELMDFAKYEMGNQTGEGSEAMTATVSSLATLSFLLFATQYVVGVGRQCMQASQWIKKKCEEKPVIKQVDPEALIAVADQAEEASPVSPN